MKTRKKHKHVGSSVDAFLKAEGILESANVAAANAVLAWEIAQEMKRKSLTKTAMAKVLGTNRAQLDRWLDPSHEKITVATLKRVADKLGKQLVIEFA